MNMFLDFLRKNSNAKSSSAKSVSGGVFDMIQNPASTFVFGGVKAELQENVVTRVVNILMKTLMPEHIINKINEIIFGEFDIKDIYSLEPLFSFESSIKAVSILRKTDEIEQYFSQISYPSKNQIINFLGNYSRIENVKIYSDNSARIETRYEGIVAIYPSGRYIISFDTDDKCGYETFDTSGRSVYVIYADRKCCDSIVRENTLYCDDEIAKRIIRNSSEPDIKRIILFDSTGNKIQIKTENVHTGEITVNYQKR